ncbi:pseudo histidine-containing phosphotransfer protein 5-like [Fagus crenata]
MAWNSLQQQIAYMRQSFFDEGILNEQFIRLESLEDERNPNVINSMFISYFTHAQNYFLNIDRAVRRTKVNVAKLDSCLRKFKHSSDSCGAQKMMNGIDQMLQCCWSWRESTDDEERLRIALQSLKAEYNTLKNKMEAYLELLRQATPAHSSNPPSNGTAGGHG